LREAGDLLGIKLLDHLILGDDRLYSFADQGWPLVGDSERHMVPVVNNLFECMTPVDTFTRFQIPTTSGGLFLRLRTPKNEATC
jgi:hypothetical protein